MKDAPRGGAVDRRRLLDLVDAMAGTPVVAVADLVLDVFEHGRIGRISREAPVLILDHVRTERRRAAAPTSPPTSRRSGRGRR